MPLIGQSNAQLEFMPLPPAQRWKRLAAADSAPGSPHVLCAALQVRSIYNQSRHKELDNSGRKLAVYSQAQIKCAGPSATVLPSRPIVLAARGTIVAVACITAATHWQPSRSISCCLLLCLTGAAVILARALRWPPQRLLLGCQALPGRVCLAGL